MFTGIVEELGRITGVQDQGESALLSVTGPLVASDARPGDSIAVNGVCLTVVLVGPEGFTADVMAETLKRSTLAGAVVGSPVNLERAVRADGRLGGHIVQGHVDGTAVVSAVVAGEHWTDMSFDLSADLVHYIVEKGSITVDGVSLTVVSVREDGFTVSLIPTTLGATTLGTRSMGDRVNIEVDILAKYVERLLAGRLT